MPRISAERREARRREYLDAAWRVFGRVGVVPATLEQIATEAGGAAGSVYLYFPGKDEVVRAAIAASVDRLAALIARLPAGASWRAYGESVLDAVASVETNPDGVNLFALAVQGWSQAQVDPETAALIGIRYRDLLAGWERIAAHDHGSQTPAADAEALAQRVLGFVAFRAVMTADTR